MNKSNIAQGQMFLHYNPNYMDRPKVWVKVENRTLGNHYGEDTEEVSLFVDNNAMVKVAINPNYTPDLTEKWSITDDYYNLLVQKGEFVPLDDLREVDGICKEREYPLYQIDLGF